MFGRRATLSRCVLLVAMLTTGPVVAQQVTISVPQQTISNGYYEYIGGRWVYFGPGFSLAFGGPPPPLWGYDPNAGLTGGFAFGGPGTGGRFDFLGAAGGSTTFTSSTPMLTVTNGVPGSITAGRFTPFVTSVTPVLGGGLESNPAFNNLGAANSIQGRIQRGEMHIRDGRVLAGPDPLLELPSELAAPPLLFPPPPNTPPEWQQAHSDQQVIDRARTETAAALQLESSQSDSNTKARELFEKARQLEERGKIGAARLLYQTALRQSSGGLRDEIATRLGGLP